MARCDSGGLLRTISVSTDPGANAFTRMSWAAYSAAMERVKDMRAAFPAAYMATEGEKMNAPTEMTLRTAACELAVR